MRATLLTSALIAIFAIACDDAAPPNVPATPTPTPGVGERLDAAATVAATRAGEARFNGEILGLYIAPNADDWPAAIREERDRRVAGGCTASASARSEFGFMQALNPPPGFTLPSPDYDPAGQGVACSGRATGVTFEYHRANPDGTPATVTIARGVTRAFGFDAPSSDVNALTVGARQAVLIASLVPDAPAQRAMLIFPEDFGSTAIYAFGLRLQDLLALGEAVAAASAPYWERLPDGTGIPVRVCSEIPEGAISHQAAFGFTEGELTTEETHSFFVPAPPPNGKSYALRLYPGDSFDGCEGIVGDSLAFGSDPALFDAVRAWLAAEGGELSGECATRPLILGADPALADWCYYRPRRLLNDTIVLTVERGPGDGFRVPLTMRRTADGSFEIIEDEVPPASEPRLYYFRDDHSFRWTRLEGAASHRLRATFLAIREHAGDPCAAPPLVDQLLEIPVDVTFPADVDRYTIELPDLPPEDTWYVALGGDGSVHLEALDADGEVIDARGTAWVRDTFCAVPRAGS